MPRRVGGNGMGSWPGEWSVGIALPNASFSSA